MERLDFETLFRIVRWDYNRCFKDESLDKDLFMGKYGKVMGEHYYNKFVHDDDLFDKQIHKVRKFYLSRNPDKMMMLEERKAVIKERNKGLSPEYDKEYYCGTCGAKDGAEHPKTGYCFHCDTDNWISKNN